MKRIAIIGHGTVGKGMERLFGGRFEIVIYDPASGCLDRDAVNRCDLGIVCVPTPSLPDGSADISSVTEVVGWLSTPLILLKSTVPPGTTDRLARHYGKALCFSPEYMGESIYFTPPWKYPDPGDAKSHTFVIIGGAKASEIAGYFMKVMGVDTRYSLTSAIEAELTKYMENAFFAVKVAFCNEFFNIATAFGVDYKSLRENWLLDPRINPNHTLVFEDDRGFGGKCLPKDLRAIVKASADAGYVPRLLAEAWETNLRIRSMTEASA
jgi:nucleotide sugar dehydrogenase